MTDDPCKPTKIERVPCIECALKHLGQARAIQKELTKGYPHFTVFIWGHMAEAEDELTPDFIEQANIIRNARITYQFDEDYELPIDDLIGNLFTFREELKEKQMKELGYE